MYICRHQMRELRSKNDNSIGFIDPYIIFKAPQAVDSILWDRSLHQSYDVLREPKIKTKNTLPLQLRVSYIVIKCMHILFYLLLGEFPARCCGIFLKINHYILGVFNLLCMYTYEFDLHVFYCIISSKNC